MFPSSGIAWLEEYMSDQHILAHFGSECWKMSENEDTLYQIQSKFTELHELASCHSTTNFTMYLRNLTPSLSMFKLELTFTGILASPQNSKKNPIFLTSTKAHEPRFSSHQWPWKSRQRRNLPHPEGVARPWVTAISEALKYLTELGIKFFAVRGKLRFG